MPQAPLNFPCANCGAHLSVDGSSQTPTCTYCHTQTLLPQDVWLRFHPPVNAPPLVVISAPATPPNISALVWIGPIVVVAVMGMAIVLAIAGSGGTSSSAPRDPLANVGDACNGRTAACSRDKRANLECGAGDKMIVTNTCKGPNGCQVSTDGTTVSCDYTLADVKDPCDTTDDACSTDHKSELACIANHFSVRSTCKGPDGCTLTPSKKGSGFTLSCDDHVADVGDPCFDAERTACSSDHKSFLVCTGQKFAVDHTCKKSCTAKKLPGVGGVEMECL